MKTADLCLTSDSCRPAKHKLLAERMSDATLPPPSDVQNENMIYVAYAGVCVRFANVLVSFTLRFANGVLTRRFCSDLHHGRHTDLDRFAS